MTEFPIGLSRLREVPVSLWVDIGAEMEVLVRKYHSPGIISDESRIYGALLSQGGMPFREIARSRERMRDATCPIESVYEGSANYKE